VTIRLYNRLRVAPSFAFLVLLTGCNEVASQQSVSGPPTVEVAQPTKRIVTDWDEFTGRFEAVEEVQVRARVGGFVTSVEFRDGTFVNAGDLLYVVDSRPFEAVKPWSAPAVVIALNLLPIYCRASLDDIVTDGLTSFCARPYGCARLHRRPTYAGASSRSLQKRSSTDGM
jgi:hypothetical protein